MVLDKLRSLKADVVLPASYLAAEWPIRDIALKHEAVVNVAPDAAVPVAAALTPDCILKVGVAIVLAHDFARKRRAHPSEQFHRNTPKPALTLANDTPTVQTSRPSTLSGREQKACLSFVSLSSLRNAALGSGEQQPGDL
jgi:hypothetical protein